MNEKRTKLNSAQAVLLAALAVGALIVACDTPVPTQVQDALIEAMDEEAIVRTEAEMEQRAEELLLARASALGPAPLIYIDGVRIDGISDLEDLDLPSLGKLNPDNIDRIEVIKGPAAERLYGEEGANGVIQIFMKLEDVGAEGDDLEFRVQGDPQERKVAIKGNVLVPTRNN